MILFGTRSIYFESRNCYQWFPWKAVALVVLVLSEKRENFELFQVPTRLRFGESAKFLKLILLTDRHFKVPVHSCPITNGAAGSLRHRQGSEVGKLSNQGSSWAPISNTRSLRLPVFQPLNVRAWEGRGANLDTKNSCGQRNVRTNSPFSAHP